MTVDQESLEELFTTLDIEGLIAAGAPADEYEPEMEQLTATLAAIPPGHATEPAIVELLAAIWRTSFSATEDHIARVTPAFESLAATLLEHYS